MHGRPGDKTKPAAVPGISPRSHGAAHSSSISSVTSVPPSAMNSLSMTPPSIPVKNAPLLDTVCNHHRLAHLMQLALAERESAAPNCRIDSIIALFVYPVRGCFSSCRWVKPTVSPKIEGIDKISRIQFMVFVTVRCNRCIKSFTNEKLSQFSRRVHKQKGQHLADLVLYDRNFVI